MNQIFIKVLIGIILVTAVAIVGTQFGDSGAKSTQNTQGSFVDKPITIYKTPACSCCGLYAAYIEGLGYQVDLQLVDDIDAVKERLGVPYDLQSCHTSEIDGYVVEGHVPIEAIEKMLSERPDIAGIALPGMPSGSPGMPGEKEDFVIYVINHDGTRGDIFVTL